jgi:hypothetical protein
METKEILALVLAAFGIILVIGILSMITNKNGTTKEDSAPEITQATQPDPVYLETDIWDLIREQNQTTVTTDETTEAGGSGESGEETGTLPEGAETGDVTGEVTGDVTGDVSSDVSGDVSGFVSAITVEGAGSNTETTAVTEQPHEVQTYRFIIG